MSTLGHQPEICRVLVWRECRDGNETRAIGGIPSAERIALPARRGWKRRSDLSLRHVRRVDCNITRERLATTPMKSNSRNDLPDLSRLRAPKTRNLPERDLVGRDDALHRAKVKQQAIPPALDRRLAV
jgi:hypothetical protein